MQNLVIRSDFPLFQEHIH